MPYSEDDIKKIKAKNYVVFAVFISGLIMCIILTFMYKQSRIFNSERWIEHPEKRIKMHSDLERNYQLEGMSKAEIIKLLGSPDGIQDCPDTISYYSPDTISIDGLLMTITFEDDIAVLVDVAIK